MISRNAVCVALGLVLLACLISVSHCSDPGSIELLSDNDPKNDDLFVDKRPFFVGSRYGRSPRYLESKSRRFSIAPRNDRFFLGSRYGKRAELPSPAFEQTSVDKLNLPFMMSCIYTGVKNFYRCSRAAEINDILNELTGNQNETDK